MNKSMFSFTNVSNEATLNTFANLLKMVKFLRTLFLSTLLVAASKICHALDTEHSMIILHV